MKTTISSILLTVLIATPLTTTALEESAVRDYFTGWNTGDITKIMGYFSADIVYEDVPKAEIAKGPAEVKAFVEKFFTDFAGARLAVSSVTVGETGAAAEWIISGGSGEDAWSVRGASVMEHAEGKISRVTDYWDK